MKFSIALAALLATFAVGCATSGNGLPGRDGKGPGGPTFPAPDDDQEDASRSALTRISDPDLHAADRLYHRIAAEHAGAIATQVRLCVAPTGTVDRVEIVAPSGLAEYDRTVVDAVSGWQYAAFAAPAETRVCENLTVAYRAP